jgi:hypothetical protein
MNSPLVFDARTEDLLVKYFDGALNTAEEQEFSLLRAAMPTLEAEIQRIRAFDTFLDKAQLSSIREEELDTAFLWDMQKRFAQALAVGTVLAAPDHASQLSPEPASPNDQSPIMVRQQEASSIANTNTTALNTTVSQNLTSSQAAIVSSGGMSAVVLKTSLVVKTLAAALFAGSVAYGVWRFAAASAPEVDNPNSASTTTNAPNAQSTTQQLPTTTLRVQPRAAAAISGTSQPNAELPAKSTTALQPPNAATNSTPPPAPQQPVAQANETSAADSKHELNNETKTDATANAQISTSNDKFRRDAEELTKKIQAKEQSGDLIGAAFVLKQLGFLQRTNGDAAGAIQSFNQALKTAQSQNVRELEAELLGELALVYAMQGNTTKAQTLLKTCTDILSELNSKRLERWMKEMKELRRLEGK